MNQIISAVYDGKILYPLEQPDLPKNSSVVLEVKEVHPGKSSTKHKRLYKLADLAGKLEWQGNPIEMQRKLRDEW